MYIDIHNHILPAIDDGARSIEESKVMIARYIDAGFSTVVATPHVVLPDSPLAQANRDDAFQQVLPCAQDAGLDLSSAAEVRLTPDVGADGSDPSAFTLGSSQYLLVDFSSGTWPFYAEDALFRVQTIGLAPILAHPERYGWFMEDVAKAKGLVDRGVLIQVTLGSFAGAFGSQARKMAIALLEQGLVHMVATDAHGPRGRMDSAIAGLDWIRSTYGEPTVSTLLHENPAAMLSGEQIDPVAVNRHWRARLPILPRFFQRRR